MDKETFYVIIFIILGALGLVSIAEWFFINVMTPIGEIVKILEWMSTLNDATPITLVVDFMVMTILPVLVGAYIYRHVKERMNI